MGRKKTRQISLPALVAAEEVVIEHVVPTPLFTPPLNEELPQARVEVQQEALYRSIQPQFFGQCRSSKISDMILCTQFVVRVVLV